MMSAAISASPYSSGVSTSVSGMPMINAAKAHSAVIRQVARRFRFCAWKNVSGLGRTNLRTEGAASGVLIWAERLASGRSRNKQDPGDFRQVCPEIMRSQLRALCSHAAGRSQRQEILGAADG